MNELKYKLLKPISHPFNSLEPGEIKTTHEWLALFGVDWLLCYEVMIEKNESWFEKVS